MRKIIKPFIISVTLLLPVAIYLFLRYFGTNQFNVPVFYELGVNPDTVDCRFNAGPHIVSLPNSQANQDATFGETAMTLIDLSGSVEEARSKINKLKRIYDLDLAYKGIRIFQFVKNEHLYDNKVNINAPWDIVYIDSVEFREFARCQLILLEIDQHASVSNRWVLIDAKSQIRGYYDSQRFDEIDRLIVEIKIIDSGS